MVTVVALDRSVELRRSVDGGTKVQVVVSVDANGNLVVAGHDEGTAPNKLLGARSYDHWVIVADEDKDLVLLELLRERFSSLPAPAAEFMEWLKEHDVPHEVGSTAGKHRGPARQPKNGTRRKSPRTSKRTRGGP